ncbi:MAG: MarR family winged helix-turn-helix transcriptional regulator [Canibacter sp.]
MGNLDRISLNITKSSARFTRTVSLLTGMKHSSVVWRVLADLEQAQSPVRTSQLAARHRVTQPTMTGIIQRLEGFEWVGREPDPDDGRAALISLKPAGVAALAEYRAEAAKQIRPLLSELSENELDILNEAAVLMERVCDLSHTQTKE